MCFKRLVNLLRERFDVSENAIHIAMGRCAQISSLLPVALWNSGFITLDQLDTIWNVIEAEA